MRNNYGELGINITTAINMFLRQSLRVMIPFYVRMEKPNNRLSIVGSIVGILETLIDYF